MHLTVLIGSYVVAAILGYAYRGFVHRELAKTEAEAKEFEARFKVEVDKVAGKF